MCQFALHKLHYLGHILLLRIVLLVATDPEKIKAMVQLPTPATVTELKGFLGFTGYYRRFVRNFGIMAKPLTNLLRRK